MNSFLFWTGMSVADHPISQLLYSKFAVVLVLIYVWLPFVALPIFVSLESLDRRLLEAATDLGATRWQAFLRVTLPLSAPGVIAAFLFVFIPTVGEFVTPSLVGGTSGYMYGNQISDLFGTGFPDWRTGSVLALFLLAVVAVLTGVFSRFLGMRQTTELMDAALSKNGRRGLRGLFGLVIVFLYAPIAILLLFSFNDSVLPSFPLSGFTLTWYRQFVTDPDLIGALETSAIVAAISSVGAVALGTLASIALVRRRFRGKSAASALLLSPLVVPYVVLGISLLLLFHALGVPRTILTVIIGHIVISLPYTLLVLIPRLEQIDVGLEEAAYDLGAAHAEHVSPHHVPADPAGDRLGVSDLVHDVVRRVRRRVVRRRNEGDVPALPLRRARFPSRLPEVLAVAGRGDDRVAARGDRGEIARPYRRAASRSLSVAGRKRHVPGTVPGTCLAEGARARASRPGASPL